MSSVILKSAGSEITENVAKTATKSTLKNTFELLTKNIGKIAIGTGITIAAINPSLFGDLVSNAAKGVGNAVGETVKAAAPGVGEGVNSVLNPIGEITGNAASSGFNFILTNFFKRFGLTKEQGIMLVYVIIVIITLIWLYKFINN